MELILWRHADAEDGTPDLARRLTKKGRKQAERVAEWLEERLPGDYVLLCSPALRERETPGAPPPRGHPRRARCRRARTAACRWRSPPCRRRRAGTEASRRCGCAR